MPAAVPSSRIRTLNDAPLHPEASCVLYWMVAARRTRWSFALQRAVEHAESLRLPLIVFEPLRIGYPHASPRLHRFVLDGMRANAADLEHRPVTYLPYVEPEAGAGQGLLAALAAEAAVVVTDDYPTFFLPRMQTAAARKIPVRMEAVDGSGLLPLRSAPRVFARAQDFRRYVHRTFLEGLPELPAPDPFERRTLVPAAPLPAKLRERWPAASGDLLAGAEAAFARLPLAGTAEPVATRGGQDAASSTLETFVAERLARYAEDARHPDARATSGLSPYLHFGHVAAHEVFVRVVERLDRLPKGFDERHVAKQSGFWGLGAGQEAFLEQLVTWRELGYHACAMGDEACDVYAAVPKWAQRTLAAHADDPRPQRYEAEEMEQARTHDEVWNAAQRELLREGRIHNYLRMLWGKRILEWSPNPETAFATMLELNDRYALDGRDPNSYSGILWVLGRFDRPWGPERPIFGTVRYMSSEATLRKLRMKEYMARYGRR